MVKHGEGVPVDKITMGRHEDADEPLFASREAETPRSPSREPKESGLGIENGVPLSVRVGLQCTRALC